MPITIKNVKMKYEPRLMVKPGVVSVGIGQDDSGQSAIIIGVESQEKLDQISLPDELDGFPVQVKIIGTLRAQ